jgi:hypothetical protein
VKKKQMENVIKAHLRTKVESIDQFVKMHAKQCLKDTSPKTQLELFEHLKMKPIMLDCVELVQKWISFVSHTLNQVDPYVTGNFQKQVLSKKIWTSFVTRMSLNQWFVCSSDKQKSAEHGLEVLDLFMQVCEDVVYGSFEIDVTFQKEEPLHETKVNKVKPSKQFTTLFDATTELLDTTLPNILEENPNCSDSELMKIKNGVAYAPVVEKQGTLVKIRRQKKVSNESKTSRKPRAPKKQKPKNESDDSESD